MFRKLLEAVLKTGNRMNTGTNRGDAEAFKLDTLLKLADVKAADGKTTLLHFVVEQIIRAEGARPPEPTPRNGSTLRVEVELHQLGLRAISSLSRDLIDVKKAAGIELDVLGGDVGKLSAGMRATREAVEVVGGRFSENAREFLRRGEAEMEIVRARAGGALSMVNGLTEYFHGESGRAEGCPTRLFGVVREFLGMLDRVCKDVGRMNERATVNVGCEKGVNVGPNGPVFMGLVDGLEMQLGSSSDERNSGSV